MRYTFESPRPKEWRFGIILTEHVYDKLVELDITLPELRSAMAGTAVVVEVRALAHGVKEVVLLLDWRQPLHVVVVVDDERREERIVTLYEPDAGLWWLFSRRRR